MLGMTFFEWVDRVGQMEVSRLTRVPKSTIHRSFHGHCRVNERLLNACQQALPGFDRTGTLVEWDRRRSNPAPSEAA